MATTVKILAPETSEVIKKLQFTCEGCGGHIVTVERRVIAKVGGMSKHGHTLYRERELGIDHIYCAKCGDNINAGTLNQLKRLIIKQDVKYRGSL